MTTVLENMKQTIAATWWAVLLSGIIVALMGLLLLLHPEKTVVVMVRLLGISWLVGGVLGIGASLMGGDGWGWRLVGGIVGLGAGMVIVANPVLSSVMATMTLVYVLAFTFLFHGISEMIFGRRVAGLGTQWSWGSFFGGLLHVLIAIALFGNSYMSAATLVLMIGVLCLIAGAGQVIFAFQVKSAA